MLERIDSLPQFVRFLIALPIIFGLYWLSSYIVFIFSKSPEWLRWILFLPVSVLISFLVIALCMFTNGRLFQYIQPIVVMLAAIFTLNAFAPRWKSGFALSSIIFRIVVVVSLMSFLLASGQSLDKTSRFELIRELPAWAISLWVYYHFLKKSRINSPA